MSQSAPVRSSWARPSVWMLVAVNLVPVYGVLALDWAVFPIVLLFWIENVVLGVLNVLRMIAAKPSNGESAGAKFFFVPFFTFHYGMFTLVHGIFVFVLFAGDGVGGFSGPFEIADLSSRAMEAWQLGVPVAALTASHIFSFVSNYLLGGEYRRTTLQQLMARPYGRIVVLHVAILGGGFLVHLLRSPAWALILLLVLKIGLDVRAHMREHDRALAPAAAGDA